MCGRIACALGSDALCCATSAKSKDTNAYVKTKIHKLNKDVKPSYNIPPTASAPVLVSTNHKCFQSEDMEGDDSDRLLVSMRFGIIPHWLKPEQVKSNTHESHLCRVERLKENKLVGPLYEKGFRCAIPCLGYYEWQSTNASKQPYFFFNKDNKVTDLNTSIGCFDGECGWTGVKLLYLAGIFNKYTDEGKTAYSFAIITQEASEEWKWVHHRMPVVLQSEEAVNKWIQYTETPDPATLEILKTPVANLATHPVDKNVVNKTKNNLSSCIVPIELNKPVNKLMSTWLNSEGTREKRKETSDKTKESEKTNENKPMKRPSLDAWLALGEKKRKTE